MIALSPRFAAAAARRPKLIALALGIVSATGFAPLHLWPLTLLALAGWLALVARCPKGRGAFGVGWAFGVGHFAVGLNWIATAFTFQAAMPAWLGWIAVLLLSLYLAIYPALAAWGAWSVLHSIAPAQPRAADKPASATIGLSFILAFAALWTLTEWLRSWIFTGFAWNPLSAIQLQASVPAIWVGTYGASAFILLIAGAFLLAAAQQLRGGIALATSTGLIILAASLWQDHQGTQAQIARESGGQGRPVPVTIVQPNIGQQDKWVGDKADANFVKLAQLTSPRRTEPRLILWPEAAIPDYLEAGYPAIYYDRAPAQARARLTALMNPDDLMLLGALKLELDQTGNVIGARNAVMTVHADGTLGPRYDKAHLVPYGEYLPMRPLLSVIGLSRLAPGDMDFWPGAGPRTLDLAAFGQAGLQICYEIIFSGQVVDRTHRPDFIFNPSNDAWFGNWGPPQHLAQARLRAIEEGLPVVRATPTGISALIAADGRVLRSLPLHHAGRIDAVIPPPHAPTLFARYGNLLPVGFALLLLAAAIAFRRRGR